MTWNSKGSYCSQFIKFFFYAGLILGTYSGFAQQDKINFSHLDISDGLSNNQVRCIFKDSKGYMWIGTMSGLNRYNGYDFTTFKHSIRDSTTINNNFISNIYEDHKGRIWVNTRNGFNIYHQQTGDFTRDPTPILKQLDIHDSGISKIYKDKAGNYWFVGVSNGLFQHLVNGNKTVGIHNVEGDSTSIITNQITDIKDNGNGFLWVIHQNGILEQLDIKSKKVVYRNSYLNKHFNDKGQYYEMSIDSENNIWIYATNNAIGVFKFNINNRSVQHIHKNSSGIKISSDIVSGVVEDNKGNIWIATDHGGINLYDPEANTVSQLTHSEEEEKSLSQNSITSIYKDDLGIIWVGTFKQGINYYHENIIKFRLVSRHPSDPNSLSFDDVNCFEQDTSGNFWIGTNGGGLIYYDRENDKFKQYMHDPNDPNSLSNNVIVSLLFDHEQKLWIGTYFGGLDVFDGNSFKHFKHDPDDPASLIDNRVWDLYEDDQNNIWVGTLGGGLDIYDRSRERFYHYKSGEPNSVQSDYILKISKINNDEIWIGTSYGIDVYKPNSGRFYHLGNESGLSNFDVNTIFQDSRGKIWVGTREGLNLFNKEDSTFTTFRTEHGLPGNTILTVLEDHAGNLWLSTAHGLSNMVLSFDSIPDDSVHYTFKNYDVSDGLQGIEFNANAGFKTKEGELIFGGPNGFNIFDPREIKENKIAPKVVLTDLQVFNKSVLVGEKLNGRVLLNNTLGYEDEIVLKHNEDVFSISFAALSYFQPEKCNYAYILEGFNNHWLQTNSDIRKATYTNLDPGDYTFKVKASNSDGVWSEESKGIKITILPPFWETPLAFTLYFIIAVIVLLASRKIILERERMKFRIQQERQEAQRMHELDMMKIRFFTNVSHEFRTPLTLILTPLERLLKSTNDGQLKQQYSLMYKNGKRLLNLVNQLLDFRKMEVDKFEFRPVKSDIIHFVKEATESFSDLSEKKNISLDFKNEISELYMQFDPDKLEKVLFNLLSNAFKFTQENGHVSVETEKKFLFPNFTGKNEKRTTSESEKVPDERSGSVNFSKANRTFSEELKKSGSYSNGDQEYLVINVRDTGIGISTDQQTKIFDRFVQSKLPGSVINQGSGIGLALAKEFVKLHDGKIEVNSVPNEGSCFTIYLPIRTDDQAAALYNKEEIKRGHDDGFKDIYLDTEHSEELRGSAKRYTVLIVEDNEDFRFYLKDNLRSYFKIIDAANGREGWKKAISALPDMIISDVMMPDMDGVELCQKIKADQRTSHIPVILLTARASDDQKLSGLEIGADDYITKPFTFELLLYRMRNLITLRESIRKQFQSKIDVSPGEIKVESLDEKLIQNAIEAVENNISTPEFSVVDLSKELGVSRVHLYKKLLALTGSSPTEFIRTLRLKRAAQLLEQSQLNVSEIAYKVGYNNPKYFTKHFKKAFNTLPSQYAAGKRSENKLY